jgi:hypothetical protein
VGLPVAIVPAALWHSKPSFAPKALHLLVIDCPAFGAGSAVSQRRIWMVGARAAGDLRLPAGVPGQNVSIRDLREHNFRQSRVSQKPLERGVFTLKAFEPLGPWPRPGLVSRLLRRPSSGRADGAFQWPAESKRYRRWKVCRTQGKQPISRGEYSLSRREQLGRQRLYPSVTI